MDLRPPSLDELGLLPTVEALSREFSSVHPGISVEHVFPDSEARIPPPLKIIIYRCVELALKAIARAGSAGQVRIALRREENEFVLGVDDDTTSGGDLATEWNPYDVESRFAAVKERVVLSGGEFGISKSAAGKIHVSASWPISDAANGSSGRKARR
jgi:signal transduction histidine kinase